MGSSSTRAAPPTPLDLTKAGYKRGSISSIESTDSVADSQLQKTGSKASTWNSHKSKHHHQVNSPTVNVYTTCGRHTNQFLFGGRSLADLARAVLGHKKKDE